MAPQSETSILVRIRAVQPSLAPAEQRVAAVVLSSPPEVAQLTISELADKASTSETTVIRFCRELGLRGYPQLRLALAAQGIDHRRTAVGGDIAPDDSLDKVVAKVAYADASAIDETASQLDVEILGQVVEKVVGARRIDLYGQGASAFVALDLQQKLHRIGLVSFAWSDIHIALTSAALLGSEDVAIAISHTGSTAEVIDALREARSGGATAIAITNFPRSKLAAEADLVLTTAARETTFRSGATASRIAQLMVIDSLFIGVAQQRFPDTRKALERTAEAVTPRHTPGE